MVDDELVDELVDEMEVELDSDVDEVVLELSVVELSARTKARIESPNKAKCFNSIILNTGSSIN